MTAKDVFESELAKRAQALLIYLVPLVALYMWDGLKDTMKTQSEQLAAIEERLADDASKIQDHESRLVFGRTASEQFQGETAKALEKINGKLDGVGNRVGELSNSIGQLQAVLNERLPAKSTRTGRLEQ